MSLVSCLSVSVGRGRCPSGAVLSVSRTWALGGFLPSRPSASRPPSGATSRRCCAPQGHPQQPLPPAAPPRSLSPGPAAGEWCLPSLLSLFQLLVSCVALTSASSDSWAGAHSGLLGAVPRGRAVRLCSTRPGAPPVHPGGAAGQLKAGSLGALPGEAASPPSPEHCEQSWRCHPLPHSLLTPTARFGLQHVEARPTAVQAVLRPLSPAPCGHQSLCGSLLCFPLEGQLPVGRGRCNPGCIPTSAQCLVTT